MARTYYAFILAWNWALMVTDARTEARAHTLVDDRGSCDRDACDDAGHVGFSYLGSVMNIYPSGKFYMPWTTNQTADDVDRDSRFGIALDRAAVKHDGWIESGEGDPTDLYFGRYFTLEELA